MTDLPTGPRRFASVAHAIRVIEGLNLGMVLGHEDALHLPRTMPASTEGQPLPDVLRPPIANGQ